MQGPLILNPSGLVTHQSENSRGPSHSLWADYFAELNSPDGDTGMFSVFDDFEDGTTFASAVEENGYKTYQDGSCTIAGYASEFTGVLEFTNNDTDNDELSIESGSGLIPLGEIDDSDRRDCWFEARIKVDTITSRTTYVGLAEVGSAQTATILDAGTLKTGNSFLGFFAPETDPDGLDFVHAATAGTTGGTALITDAHTLVANTYVKLGFKYKASNNKVTAYVDGVANATTVAPTADDFPDGEAMSMYICFKSHAGSTTHKSYLDWWAFAQKR